MGYQDLEIRRQNVNTNGGSKPRRMILQGNEVSSSIPDAPAMRRNGIRIPCERGDFYLTNKDLETGLLCIGATGNGKTTFLFKLLDGIIPYLGENDVFIIFDTKGDYRKRYYSPDNPNHIIISLNPDDFSRAKHWNIFGELIDSNGMFGPETEIIAAEISKALFKSLESESQPFFHITASDLYCKILLTFVREAVETRNFSKLNNEYLSTYISSVNNQDLIARLCRHKDFSYIQSYVGNGQSNQALGIYGYLMSAQNKNMISTLRRKTPSGDFSIRRLIRNKGKKIIFLEYDVKYAEVLADIYSLFFDLAIKEALSCANGNTYFVCDELNLLPHVSRFEQLLNFGRARGCKTIAGLQSVSQLRKNYGEDEANSILSGFLASVCFNCVDYPTRKYVKERFGETFEAYNYGASNITRDGFTVTDSDIINLGVGEAFIDMKGVPPFSVRFRNNI